MMAWLLCLLDALITLAVVVLILYVLWWGLLKILSVFDPPVAIPPKVVALLQVIAVLVLVAVFLKLILLGGCGAFGLSIYRVR